LLSEIRRHRPNASFYGLDFSQKAVEVASASFPDGSFLHHVIDKSLPYPSGRFDVVLCTDVLEHLEWPKLIAAELVRLCRPGGIVVIVVPDGDVDQFLGHYWFWNQDSLSLMLAEWKPQVIRLPTTREFLARIQVPLRREYW
jgi:2-polyprenyl-3-methyl-5-hydroxy-6-metoxy-1,4-benzoquinol methylase